jgi:hypothetical protein
MRIHPSAFKSVTARIALAFTALCGAAHVSAQPTLRVTAANSSSPNAVYDVLFGAQQTTLLNADGSSFKSFHSLVLVPNSASGGVDAIVADTTGGTIVRYFGPTGTPPVSATVVWSKASNISGPQQPDGLSVDAAGNLYAITATGGPNGPQVWVLPATPITPASPTGFGAPVLLDQKFNGNEVDSFIETVVVPPAATAAAQAAYTNAGMHAGDLLVLVSNNDFFGNNGGSDGGAYDSKEPALVYDYPAAGIQQALASNGASPVCPTILLWELSFPYPSGAQPTGIDIWPIDGSVLISTNRGSILQYALPNAATNTKPSTWTNSRFTTFASVSCGSSPCPFNKMRTGMQMNTAYAFATQSTGANSGNVLYFAVPATTPTPAGGFGFTTGTAVPTSGATAGSPYGLAVAPATVVVASTTTCTSAAGCNPTGALAHVIVPGATGVNGNILEQTCIFKDPRLLADGTCPGTLNIARMCPGFAANTIPATMCGASGKDANEFAAIQTIANGVDNVPGILVQTVQVPSALIPNTTDPSCTRQVLGWTTLLGSKEGIEPEGSNIIDMGSYCDNGGVTKGNSMWLIGGQLSPAVSSTTPELVAYANQKLLNLGNVVSTATIAKPAKTALQICLIASAVLLDTHHFACAARSVYTCDQLVANTAQSYGTSSSNPNAYGDVRGRLGNLYFTINSRILRNPANTSWPLQSPPARCEDDE